MEYLRKFFEYDDIDEKQMQDIIKEQSMLDRTEFKNHMVKNYDKYL